jgi:teichuronic acid biosynthesis glycosyltransferase TuaC
MVMKVLNICILAPTPYRPPIGYGGSAIENPINILYQKDCDTRVVAPVPYAPFPINRLQARWRAYSLVPLQEVINKIKIYHPRYLSIPGILLNWSCKSTVHMIRAQFPFELIHAHLGYPHGFHSSYLAKQYHVPLVVTIQGTDMDVTARRSGKGKELLKQTFSSATVIISPTDRLAQNLKDQFDQESHVINYGIDLQKIYNGNSILRKKYAGRLIILSVCMLIPSKGVDINMFAISELLKIRKDIVYVIVGDGPDRSRLETLANDLELQGFVDFVGTVSHDKVMEYMSFCDIFTMPSWQETFGLVYVEAMAHGKPVVGCRGQGIDTNIEKAECGFLAKPKEVGSVVNALRQMLEDVKLRNNLGENGRKYAAMNFSQEHTATKTLDVYKLAKKQFIKNDSKKSICIKTVELSMM